MDLDTRIKLAIYRHFAETGRGPTPEIVAERALADVADVVLGYARLRAQRVLALATDGVSIVMAPPFSGVPTPHVVTVGDVRYFANCAWDLLLRFGFATRCALSTKAGLSSGFRVAFVTQVQEIVSASCWLCSTSSTGWKSSSSASASRSTRAARWAAPSS